MKPIRKILVSVGAVLLLAVGARALITTNLIGPLTLTTSTTNGVTTTVQTFSLQSPQIIFSYGNITNAGTTNALAAIQTVTVNTNTFTIHPLSTNAESDTYLAGAFPAAIVTVTTSWSITNDLTAAHGSSSTVTNVLLQQQQ